MKKFLYIVIAVALSFASCSKDSAIVQNTEDVKDEADKNRKIVFNFDFLGGSSYDDDSKAVKQGWAEGDIVCMFFDGITDGYLRLTNTSGSSKSWSVEPIGEIASEITAGEKTVRTIYVPFADEALAPEYSGGKWTINTGDVYFTSATATAVVTEEEDKTVIKSSVELKRYPGYVQIYIQKDARFPETVQYHCNQLDRYDKVELASDGTFTPIKAEDNEHFDIRPLTEDDPDGLVFYGILKSSQPSSTIFRVDGGFNEEGKPETYPIIFTYELENKVLEAKAYTIKYRNESYKWGPWARVLWGKYLIADGKYVQFTPGNLQVQHPDNTIPHWKFAGSQKEIIGELNAWQPDLNVFDHYQDTYQWGATGVCNNTCTPTYTADGTQYIALSQGRFEKDRPLSGRWDLIDKGAQDCAFMYSTGGTVYDAHRGATVAAEGDDWGSNVVEYTKANTFRTLSASQWNHLTSHLVTPAKRTTVGGQPGWAIVLGGQIADSYTDAEWAEAELDQGAVFFPRAGVRAGFNNHPQYPNQIEAYRNSDIDDCYKYWTCTITDELWASRQLILPASVYLRGETGKVECHADYASWGFAVRLAKDVK